MWDALIVYRKGLVLKRFCGMWMMGSQMEWNIWMGRSARMGRREVHAHHCQAASHKVSLRNPGKVCGSPRSPAHRRR